MSTSHTPGPWRVTRHSPLMLKVENHDRVIFDGFLNEPANAQLAAAAPDMLNALNVALMCMIGYTHRNEVIDNAIKTVDEAINKATGQPT